MRHPREWFSPLPIADDDDGTRRWYQRCAEWNGAPGYRPEWRWRLNVGDLAQVSEDENGDFAGVQFGVDVRLWENTGQFDYDDTDRWHDHSVTIVVWRWGVYFAWRGARKRLRNGA